MGLFNTDKKLGFGLMRLPLTNPDDGGSIDMDLTNQMVDTFLERGFTYFDTAWMYCNFRSENVVKEALVDRHPRDSFTITTKLHAGFIKTKEDREKFFREQMRKTGVSYFDYYMIHDIGKNYYKVYNELDCFTWIKEKKEAGLARHIGFSFHDDAAFLDQVLTEHPEMEFVQLQVNYLDWENVSIQSGKCCEVAAKHGKPVIVMEPVKGGTLAKLPPAVEKSYKDYAPDRSIPSWAIRFAASQPGVSLVLSGMSNMEQVLDNTGFMADFKPLNEDEMTLIRQAVQTINEGIAIPCTGCSYCTDGCPKNIPIPRYFSLYNADKQESPEKKWTSQGSYYERLTESFGKASACVGCGQCERACPQHLTIRKYLKDVAEHFEE